MQELTFVTTLGLILAKDPRYQRDAYLFVKDALDHTQKIVVKENKGELRHVSGQELLSGIRDYALAQFGPMTKMVFEEWGCVWRRTMARPNLPWPPSSTGWARK